jgi:hypothetical protein
VLPSYCIAALNAHHAEFEKELLVQSDLVIFEFLGFAFSIGNLVPERCGKLDYDKVTRLLTKV